MRIIAASAPIALVCEKMRNTVSSHAGIPGRASPAAPRWSVPSALTACATMKGAARAATASQKIRKRCHLAYGPSISSMIVSGLTSPS
jgi:hypothetical protein